MRKLKEMKIAKLILHKEYLLDGATVNYNGYRKGVYYFSPEKGARISLEGSAMALKLLTNGFREK